MQNLTDRAMAWLGVDFKDPEERVERATVRVFLWAMAGLILVGISDLIRLGEPERLIASLVFFAAAYWMDRSGRAFPRSLLFAQALVFAAGLVVAASLDDYYWLTNPSTIAGITATGILAFSLGGKWQTHVAVGWATLIIVGAGAARWPATRSAGQVVTDLVAVLIGLALAVIAIAAMLRATRQSKAEYERLMELAPVGVVELDLHAVHSWLLRNGYGGREQYEAAIESGELDPRDILREVDVLGFNTAARTDLFLARVTANFDSIGHKNAEILADVVAHIVYGDTPGPIELTVDAEGRALHRVMNWSVKHPEGQRAVLIATDITAQKKAEQALADQIRYKDDFIASVSHELRTPLTVVVGLAEELTRLDASIYPEERDELMAIVAEQSHEVANLVEDLLVAAQAAGGNLSASPVRFDLSKGLQLTLRLHSDGFDVDLTDDLTVFADPARVRQIVRNLLTNAVRHGGTNRRIASFRDGDSVVIEVRDDGPPIPIGNRDSIFEPYERTRETGRSQPESVGLGLTIARSLADVMNGDITYHHDGTESVFRLTLPTQRATDSAPNRNFDPTGK